MKEIIYIDVLIAVNLFINYFLIITVARFLYLKIKKWRLIAGEVLGAVYSLYILLPDVHIVLSILIKFIMAATIVYAVFGMKNWQVFIKTLLCFYLINFSFSGIMFAMWCMFRPNGMLLSNGVVYFNISPLILIFSTLAAYIIIEFINRTIGKQKNKNHYCEVEINFLGKCAKITAKIDTGNSLKEPFSNLPVIVARKDFISNILPEEILTFFENITEVSKINLPTNLNSIRMIPFKTISGGGLLPAFRPDLVIIKGNTKNAYVALCQNETLSENINALIGSDLID